MNKILLTFMFAVLMTTFLVSAQDVYQRGGPVDVKLVVTADGAPVASTTNCNITITNSDNDILVQNQLMSYNEGSFFNYTLDNTNDVGLYNWFAFCANTIAKGSYTGDFTITTTGALVDTDNVLVLAIIIFIGLFLAVAGYMAEKEWMIFISGVIFIISGLFFANRGLSYVDDELLQQAITWVQIGIGAILMLNSYLNYDERLS